MKRFRTAVVGAGRLGGFHAKLLSGMDDVDLLAVVDPAAEASRSLAEDIGAAALTDTQHLPELDGVVIAAPTNLHFELGRFFLEQGVHVLMEKPLADSAEHAEQLVQTARRNGCVLQTGHVERFNPAFLAAQASLGETQPVRFVEAVRTSGYSFRCIDVGVVLDLMIHDIDLSLSLLQAPVAGVEATGASILSRGEDVCYARLVTADGAIAQLHASRVSPGVERSIHWWTADGCTSVDLQARTHARMRYSETVHTGAFDPYALPVEEKQRLSQCVFDEVLPVAEQSASPDANPLRDELRDFIECCRTGSSPRVDGAAGLAAIEVAERIIEATAENDWRQPQRAAILRPPHWPQGAPHREAG